MPTVSQETATLCVFANNWYIFEQKIYSFDWKKQRELTNGYNFWLNFNRLAYILRHSSFKSLRYRKLGTTEPNSCNICMSTDKQVNRDSFDRIQTATFQPDM